MNINSPEFKDFEEQEKAFIFDTLLNDLATSENRLLSSIGYTR